MLALTFPALGSGSTTRIGETPPECPFKLSERSLVRWVLHAKRTVRGGMPAAMHAVVLVHKLPSHECERYVIVLALFSRDYQTRRQPQQLTPVHCRLDRLEMETPFVHLALRTGLIWCLGVKGTNGTLLMKHSDAGAR